MAPDQELAHFTQSRHRRFHQELAHRHCHRHRRYHQELAHLTPSSHHRRCRRYHHCLRIRLDMVDMVNLTMAIVLKKSQIRFTSY